MMFILKIFECENGSDETCDQILFMDGIIYIDRFIDNAEALFEKLHATVEWEERMKARKTASFGKAYNYSQLNYPYRELTPELVYIIEQLKPVIGFEPNNCLINYYTNGQSKMGYHSDQTDILEADIGIAIISLGATRELMFRNIKDHNNVLVYELLSGSLVYMRQGVQAEWQHAIPKSETNEGRMSLTFRCIL